LIWAGLLFFVCPTLVDAARGPTVSAQRLHLTGDSLTLHIAIDSLFSRRSLDAIESGMTTSITVELRLEAEDGPRLFEQALRIGLEHDIWEGRYRVVRHASGTDVLQTSDFAVAERFCTELDSIGLSPIPALPGHLILKAKVTVSPISPEQQRRTRRWLDILERGTILELFISLDRPSEQTRWIEIKRFSLEELQ
jgi:hypothetical protein